MRIYNKTRITFHEREVIIGLRSYNKIHKGIYNSYNYILIGNLDNIDDIKNIIKFGPKKSILENLKGEFFLILFNDQKLELISDRFNSIPIYYAIFDKGVIISDSLSFISKEAQITTFNKDVFFEFIYFQKISREKTIFNNIKKFSSSTILKIQKNQKTSQKYWEPVFSRTPSKISLIENSVELADLIKKSVELNTDNLNKNEKIGLFLSGGMDTRCILAASKNLNLTALTLGFSENGEYQTAKLLTELYENFNHRFIKLKKTHFSDIFEQLIELTSCSYVFDHALFYNIKNEPQISKMRYLNGYGLDFLFQGMYIPRDNFKIFGKPTYISKIRHGKFDYTSDYINNISFKFKHINPFYYVKKEKKAYLREFLNFEIKQIENEALSLNCNTLTDFYDYTIIRDISSHYSYSNILSMREMGDIRTIAFNNSILDFFLRIPYKQRLNARILKRTLKILEPNFAKIKSANHGMKITSNEYEMTLIAIKRKIIRIFSNSSKFKHPDSERRTWPDRYEHITSNKFMRNKALDLLKSDHLDTCMPYLDRDKLNPLITEAINGGSSNFGDSIARLITIDQFIKGIN